MDCITYNCNFYEQPIRDYIKEAQYTGLIVKNDKCQNDDQSTVYSKSVNDDTQNTAAFKGDNLIKYEKFGTLRYVSLLCDLVK